MVLSHNKRCNIDFEAKASFGEIKGNDSASEKGFTRFLKYLGSLLGKTLPYRHS
jgi:hypothetical protein